MSTFFFFFFLLLLSNPPPSSAQKTLSSFYDSDSPWGPLHNQTLHSPNSLFAAGFLALPTSPNLFNFSIWYLNISSAAAVFWSANPIKSPLGPNATLSFTAAGALRLVNSSSASAGENLWPGNYYSNRRRLTLDNDGNLRIYSFDPSIADWTVVWPSFYELCRVHGTCVRRWICGCPPGFKSISGKI